MHSLFPPGGTESAVTHLPRCSLCHHACSRALCHLGQISGGEFQKVQIARAIVQGPQVLVLDEPSNNLDMTNQHNTMHLVEELVHSRGICTIMTMHDINLAIHYSDRFLFLSRGRVLAYGGLEVITEELIQQVYGIESEIIDHRGIPFVVPRHSSRYHRASHRHPHDVHDHVLPTTPDSSGLAYIISG
ncbi:ABC transporter ATP-binding protein [Desulfurispirillum indicum]|uniref:ABC transporter ATP-binding protein n=1 Tax=Desulfurispirillum indicum TaxID=936456 RepID=UPI001CF9ED7D|nr:ABC transporter ATP-binding protein [Desulfurispirillum indicum]UCZ56226.1 ABC transporter ATP-binding protein [Desulfurispirillum indicum]